MSRVVAGRAGPSREHRPSRAPGQATNAPARERAVHRRRTLWCGATRQPDRHRQAETGEDGLGRKRGTRAR